MLCVEDPYQFAFPFDENFVWCPFLVVKLEPIWLFDLKYDGIHGMNIRKRYIIAVNVNQ